jgi:phytoene dehydrogenase-like protein
MDRIIADLDRQYPGIAGAIVQREMSTAETFHQYPNTPGGAFYGFAPELREFMPLAGNSRRRPLRCLGVYRWGRLYRSDSR